jgi:xanthine/uracil permease
MIRKIFKNEYFIELGLLLIFFIFETYTQNEYLLSSLVVLFGISFWVFPRDRKVKIWLWVIGMMLGFIIEVFMGFVSRSQYWNYGSFFGVPLWLPFVWGLGFESIYLLGKFIKQKI